MPRDLYDIDIHVARLDERVAVIGRAVLGHEQRIRAVSDEAKVAIRLANGADVKVDGTHGIRSEVRRLDTNMDDLIKQVSTMGDLIDRREDQLRRLTVVVGKIFIGVVVTVLGAIFLMWLGLQ